MNTLLLPVIFAVLGFLFSTRTFIKNYNKLPPYGGLILYYTILTIVIITLEYFGLIIAGIEFMNFRHTVATLLIVFSFFIIVDWESCYINIVTEGNCNNVSNIYFASEDGAFESNINIVCKLIINYLDRNLGKNKYATNFVVNFIIYITDQFMNQMKQFDSMTSSDKKILSDMVKGVKKFISEEAYNDDKEDKREVYEMVRYRYDKAIISSSSYSLKTYADFMYRVILQYKPSKER